MHSDACRMYKQNSDFEIFILNVNFVLHVAEYLLMNYDHVEQIVTRVAHFVFNEIRILLQVLV